MKETQSNPIFEAAKRYLPKTKIPQMGNNQQPARPQIFKSNVTPKTTSIKSNGNQSQQPQKPLSHWEQQILGIKKKIQTQSKSNQFSRKNKPTQTKTIIPKKQQKPQIQLTGQIKKRKKYIGKNEAERKQEDKKSSSSQEKKSIAFKSQSVTLKNNYMGFKKQPQYSTQKTNIVQHNNNNKIKTQFQKSSYSKNDDWKSVNFEQNEETQDFQLEKQIYQPARHQNQKFGNMNKIKFQKPTYSSNDDWKSVNFEQNEETDDFLPEKQIYQPVRHKNHIAGNMNKNKKMNQYETQKIKQKGKFQARSKTNAEKQNKKIKYKNLCGKYVKNCQKLQENQEQIGLEVKKLKKYFLETHVVQNFSYKPKDISLYKSLDSPILFFQYTYEDQKRYMLLRQTQKGLKNKIGDFYETIRKVYDMNYFPVDNCYQPALLQFVKKKAHQINLPLSLKPKKVIDFQNDKKNQSLFYYCINRQNQVEFIYFDYMMKEVTLNENYMVDQKRYVSDEDYQTLLKFCKKVKANDEFEVFNLGQEELDSQDESKNKKNQMKRFQDYQLQNAQNRINKYLENDLKEFKKQLEEQNNQLNEMMMRSQSNQQENLQRLAQKVDKMYTNLENFEKIKNQVQEKIKNIYQEKQKNEIKVMKLKNLLKKLIFTEKSLQSDLPILGKKKQIFQLLDKNNLVIIEGQTGSGKSTQLPQLLCEYFKVFDDLNAKPVIVTQPRKIATRSLSERVAEQLGQKNGQFVDYVSSLTKHPNPNAKIIFKLDRLLLDEIVQFPTLDAYSCLVIDQAHQRTISIDVILGLVKQLLQKRKDFKVIITSASMQIGLFQKYFNKKTLKVSGRMFPVDIKYYFSNQQNSVKKVQKFIDSELLTERNMLKEKYKGHILVFCADTSEIQALSQIFKKKLNHNVFLVIPLHGKLTPQEQKKVFSKTKQHKLIFASRIAETAITIDGVKVVIDPGWDREMQFDQKTKFSSMKLAKISQSSAKQRAGRAGRTQQGFCFRLYSQAELKSRDHNKLPQIRNIALQTLVLRLKILKIENVFTFNYIQRPNDQGMKNSIQILKMIGCLDKLENITTVGKFLVKIPIEPFLARAIIQGILMQIAQQATNQQDWNKKNQRISHSIILILCMTLNAGNLFRISQNFKQLGQKIKYQKFSHQKGDFFFFKKIYDNFVIINESNRAYLNQWLKENYLIKKTLMQVKDLVKQISTIVNTFTVNKKQLDLDIRKCKKKLKICKNQEQKILACLTTSFASNLCLYSGHPFVGYTCVNLQKTINIYGTSCLSLQGKCPKWIFAYDFYQNKETNKQYCKVANQVTYEFLYQTVEDYIFEKFRLDQIQKSNSYYKNITFSLQTYVLRQVKQYYRLRDYKSQKQYQIMKKVDIQFNQHENSIIIFFKCQKNYFKTKAPIEIQLQQFFQKIRKKTQQKFHHNYVGNIYADIKDGFKIQNVDIKNSQILYQITQLKQQTFNLIKQTCQNFYSEYGGIVQTFGKDKIKFYLDDEDTIHHFENYIQEVSKQHKIIFRKQISDKRKKIPQTKIYIHWYAGKAIRDNICIYFNRKNQDGSNKKLDQITTQTEIFKNYIQEALLQIRILKKKRFLKIVQDFGSLKLTKRGDGINLFDSGLDQIDLQNFFNDLIATGTISASFQLPKSIRKFRQPQNPYCGYNNNKWIEQINKILLKVNSKTQNCIRVWGYGLTQNPKQKSSDLEKTYRIDMKAEIKTFDLGLLQKLKEEYDGKRDILGCQKIHINSQFSQSIVAVDEKVFQYLRDEYQYQRENLTTKYPSLFIGVHTGKTRRNDKKVRLYICATSINREDLLQPMRIFKDLFTPKYIVLPDTHFRYLFTPSGDQLLEDIQWQFNYKIYFGFDKYQRKLKLYCHDSKTIQVQQLLKKRLDQIRQNRQQIIYKGKNLRRIQQLIKNQQKEIQEQNKKIRNAQDKKHLIYKIIFSNRKVEIIGDPITFNKIKNVINSLKTQQKQENLCPICTNPMITPYKLLKCSHQFCWHCLSQAIRQFKTDQKEFLKCFYSDQKKGECNEFISIYDISTILSQQQLQKICDIKISKFIEDKPQKYQRCFSPNCQHFFKKQFLQDQTQIDCQLCGKWYCLKCKESHRNYSCFEWKHRLTDDELQKLGIRKCPKCQNGIQKNKGCQHVACKCGNHICWTCMKSFKDSKSCYDHLSKECGGIFEANQANIF